MTKYYGSSDPEKMVPLVGFDEKLKRRVEIAALQDKLNQEKKQIEQEVKVYMEDAERADSDNFSVSWKSVVSNRVDSKETENRLSGCLPEVCEIFRKQKVCCKRDCIGGQRKWE